MRTKLSVGDLVLDNYGRKGVVIKEIEKPPSEWIKRQPDKRVQKIKKTRWFNAFTANGESIAVPQALAKRLRKANLKDVRIIFEKVKTFEKVLLSELFPKLVQGKEKKLIEKLKHIT